jgi:hypothetical protein
MNDIFASKSLSEHLLRGTIGFGSACAAFELKLQPGILSIAGAIGLGGLALFALRGCPMCWTIGLFNTTFNTVYKAKSCKACNEITQRPAKS